LTILSDKEIVEHIRNGEMNIAPFELSCLNPAGYDLRSANELTIKPKQYELVATLETIELGLKLIAFLHIRSSLAREGVVGSFAAVDPGFRGQLTLNLHNDGQDTVTIRKGEPIVQIVFHKLGNTATKGYSGAYQNSKGIVKSKRSRLQVTATQSFSGGSLRLDAQFSPSPQPLYSYPRPLERCTSKLRLLPPGPDQVHLVNVFDSLPTKAAPRPPAPRDGYSRPEG